MGSDKKAINIECEDVLLRTYEINDLERIFLITQEEEVRRYLPDWDVPKTQRQEWLNQYEIPENQLFIQAITNGDDIGNLRLRLAIISKMANELVGWCCCGIKEEIEPPNREIMFAISKEYTNKGYTTQAVQGIVKFLFENTDIKELIAIALIDNVPSNKVIKKSGFEFAGSLIIEGKSYNKYKVQRS